MGFKKAVREKVWLKISMTGTSGSGKTTSALRLATGLAKKCNSDIAFISSEGSRTLYNADKFNYDVLELDGYTPEKYIEAIKLAISNGYKVIIIDSTSHEWTYLNDIHSKMPGNSFTNWSGLKARHKLFMNEILQSPAHIICCSRGKTEWALEEKDGKKVPKKLGLGSEGDKQADFEFTIAFSIEQGNHIASVGNNGKDNTGLWEDRYEVISELHGEELYEWANSGKMPAKPKASGSAAISEEQIQEDDLKSIKKQIISVCTEKGGTKNTKLMETLKQYVANGNPNSIKDITKAKECLKLVMEVEKVE